MHVMDRERERMRGKNRRLIDLDGLTYQPQSWRATERMEWLNRAGEKMNERKKTSKKKKKKKKRTIKKQPNKKTPEREELKRTKTLKTSVIKSDVLSERRGFGQTYP